MTIKIDRSALARHAGAQLATKLMVSRWRAARPAPDDVLAARAAWLAAAERGHLAWLDAGGFATERAETKTAAGGRRSLAPGEDIDEEFKFSQMRMHDAAG